MTLDEYKDLVFTPLDLPAPPCVDAVRFIAWMEWVREEGIRRRLSMFESRYEELSGKPYPWLLAPLSYAKRTRVEDSFEREWPEVRAYMDLFPITGVMSTVFLAQRAGADIHLHTDSDGFWGYRFYLVNKSVEGLHFHYAHPGIDKLPLWTPNWGEQVDLNRKHYARFPDGNHPYMVNSRRAAHGVDKNTCVLGDRIAVLVFPESHHADRLHRLLEASRSRFGSYQLWYR